ncbi:MAG TPA: hypothetical protein VG406_03715 [Isosphaeraceae bacterium]|jgi:hypothetical protein|nr:hypothetical protein [Isosphaeraceae bacterium]
MNATRAATGVQGAKAAGVRPGAGGLVSKRSKTGDPACSSAMSAWVLGRASGTVAPAVYKTLAGCRAKARTDRLAAARQATGKLAPGRGTWRRQERAARERTARAAKAPAAGDRSTPSTARFDRPAPAAAGPAARRPTGPGAKPAKVAASPPTATPAAAPPPAGRFAHYDGERGSARFAHGVLAAAHRVGPAGRFGADKAFISHVHERFARSGEGAGMGLDEFKRRLVAANRGRHLDLARADLVEAMPAPTVRASHADSATGQGFGAGRSTTDSFHLVRLAAPAPRAKATKYPSGK